MCAFLVAGLYGVIDASRKPSDYMGIQPTQNAVSQSQQTLGFDFKDKMEQHVL